MIETIIGKEFPTKVIPLIEAAKHSIKIIVFDWRWYPNDPANPVQLFSQAIIRAQRRGVRIQIIANDDSILAILKQQGCETKRPITKTLIHAKIILIDGEILVIGSHNFTQNAFTMNQEISVIISEVESLERIIKYFDVFYD